MSPGIVGQRSRWLLIFILALTACARERYNTELLSETGTGNAESDDSPGTAATGGGQNGDGNRDSDDNRDSDGDGVKDVGDNCRQVDNPDQADSDGDGWGDLCDNCPIVANASQEPVECKTGTLGEDSDGDSVADAEDNCALVANFDQLNSDGDLFGDACDNCLTVANDDQANVDHDLLGDACDKDLSNEELCAEGSVRAELLKPNLYFLFDTSSSMAKEDIDNLNKAVTRLSQGPDGLYSTQDDLVNDFNVGMATFPSVFGSACIYEPHQRLALKEDNISRDLTQVLPTEAQGSTPTAAALEGVLQRQLFVLEGESTRTRPAAIVLMTDGEPNDCGGQAGTVKQAARFASIGVPVYVIAYKLKGAELLQATEVATVGSVDPSHPHPPLNATDATGIEAAFHAIRSEVVSCTFPFEAQADANFDRVQVVFHVGNETTELSEGENGYSLDVGARTGELTGSACETFQAHSGDGSASVELRVACKPACEPRPEICDFRDNNCDGNVDEGCSSKPPEVCNGVDDDDDGDIDEGCSTHAS